MLKPNAIAPFMIPENHSSNSWLKGILSANFIILHRNKYGIIIENALAIIEITSIENENERDIEFAEIPNKLRPI